MSSAAAPQTQTQPQANIVATAASATGPFNITHPRLPNVTSRMEPVDGTMDDCTSRTMPMGTAFFSGLLHPSIFTISPLLRILEYLEDWELNSFCVTNRAAQAIFPQMSMRETYQLSTENWNKIAQRNGPNIDVVRLDRLADLGTIPISMRHQIKEVRFKDIGGTVAPEWIPNQLEVFTSTNPFSYEDDNRADYGRYLCGPELPVLPPTLKQFCFGFRMNKERHGRGRDNQEAKEEGTKVYESATQMIKRLLSQTTHLTDVSISVEEGDLIAALPDMVEVLSVHMYDSAIGASWPKSLKHLSVQADNENEVELEPILPPLGLISLEMPSDWRYDHYDATMEVVNQMECLESISFGLGIRDCGHDLFASLPENIKSVKYDVRMRLEGSCDTDVNSLPDSVEELIWSLNNTPVSKWPSQLHIIEILGDEFSQDISQLPNTVTSIQLPVNYIQPVSKWPTELVELKLGTKYMDLPSMKRLPSSLESLTISVSLARKLMKSGQFPTDLTDLILLGQPKRTLPMALRYIRG